MSNRQKIFRQAALDRLASPDQIDRPLRVVSSTGWLALFVLLSALAVFLYWVTTANAPIKVNARGIIISSGGLNQIIANTQGRLKTFNIRSGDTINSGDIVATFVQTELQRELDTAKAGLVDSRLRYDQLSSFYHENDRREKTLANERVGTIKQTRKRLRERLALLRKKQANIARLFKKRIITEDILIQVQLELSDVRERLAVLDDEEKTIAIRKQERLSKQKLELLDEQLKIKQHQRSTERLKSRLGEQLNLTSSHSGRVLEVMVSAGDVVEPGKALATIAPIAPVTSVDPEEEEEEESGAAITAFVYVNPADGKRIHPGMLTEISPSAFRPEEYGYMLGKVESVSELPATIEGMSQVLKNEQLARELTQAGVPFEVRVTLLNDASTPSGYQWSSSRGPDAKITAGMLLNARVVVDRLRLINMLIPQFDRFFPTTRN